MKMKKFFYLFVGLTIILGLSKVAFAQNNNIEEGFKNSPVSISVVSENKDEIISSLENKYISILEKTNQQLSYWWNPFNIILCILAFLVAILAIYFGGIIYVQNKDYKEKLQKDREGYKSILDNLIEEQKQKHKELLIRAGKQYEELLDKYKKKIEKDLSKAEVEKVLKELEEEKKAIDFGIGFKPTINFHNWGIGEQTHVCSKCGIKYNYDNSLSIASCKAITCPYCGNIDYV